MEKEKNLLLDRAITWEWLGGFFDGEGHFTKPCWRIVKGQPYIDLNVKVDQKKEEIADFIEKEIGKIDRSKVGMVRLITKKEFWKTM